MLSSLIKIKKKKKVVGRGGDRGGTSGKGNKGQKARSGGYVKAQFEGGQTPLTRRLPKVGFNNKVFSKKYIAVSFSVLEKLSEIYKTDELTREIFEISRIIKKKERIKILSNGNITKALKITVDACSKSAKEKIEAVGGSINFIKSDKIETK
jgi:large subunit ribosomal protein L15